MLDHLGCGDEIPLLAQGFGVGVIVEIVQGNLMAVFAQHHGQRRPRAAAEIQAAAGGWQARQQGLCQA